MNEQNISVVATVQTPNTAIVNSGGAPSIAMSASSPRISELLKQAEVLFRNGAANRVELGLKLIELQKATSCRGAGTGFLTALKAIGIRKSTAYDYMDQARESEGLAIEPKIKKLRKQRMHTPPPAPIATDSPDLLPSGSGLRLCVDGKPEELTRLQKAQKQTPRGFEKVLHEVVRLMLLYDSKTVLATLDTTTNFVGRVPGALPIHAM